MWEIIRDKTVVPWEGVWTGGIMGFQKHLTLLFCILHDLGNSETVGDGAELHRDVHR